MSSAADVDLGIPSLDSLVAKLTNHLEVRNVPREEVDKEVEKLKTTYQMYTEAQKRELTVSEISLKYSVSQKNVRNYQKTIIPRLLRTIIDLGDDNSVVPKKEESEDLAYILGALMSMRGWVEVNREKQYAVHMIETDSEIREEITKASHKFGIRTTISGNYLRLHHGRTTKYLSDIITRGKVPWEHLVTQKERRAFLAGYLDRVGTPRSKGRINKANFDLSKLSLDMAYDLVLLFGTVGICARCVENKGKVNVTSKRDVEYIRDTVRSKARKQKIQRFIDKSEEDVDLDVMACVAVLNEKKEHPNRKMGLIYRSLGIEVEPSYQSTYAILSMAKRYLAVQKLREEQPDYNVIGYCYRECGTSSDAARALAGVYSMDEIREYDPDTINKWSQIYDEDSSVEVDLERNIMQVVEASIRELANAVINGGTSPAEARESINPIAKASGVPFDRLDDLYWSVYGAALNGHRGEE